MIKAAIIGVTGYAGQEIVRILLNHKDITINYLFVRGEQPVAAHVLFPWLTGRLDMICDTELDAERIAADNDVIFLALPHRVSMEMAPRFLSLGKRVIDLSADYRLKDAPEYQKWYGVDHKSPEFLKDSVYGLPELWREQVAKAQLLANPGCYPTAAILACAPFLKQSLIAPDIIIDAISGASGAGKSPSASMLFAEVNENVKAYKVCTHQHTPEIVQQLQSLAGGATVAVTFVPHLAPLTRGILCTVHAQLATSLSVFEAVDMCRKFYQHAPFVRVRAADEFPELKDVAYSNFCDVGIKVFGRRLVIISAIDNLMKGAAGQAVQNCNIMFNLTETAGLLP